MTKRGGALSWSVWDHMSAAKQGRTRALAFLTREHCSSQSMNISSIGGKLNLNNSQRDLLSSWAASGKLCSLAPLCKADIHFASHTSPEAERTGQLRLMPILFLFKNYLFMFLHMHVYVEARE